MPPNWLSQARDLAPDKPFAIAETGWPAETLWIPELFIWVESSWAWQDDYLRMVSEAMDAYAARFFVWFLAVDYDDAWEVWEALGIDPGFMVWRDTGLYDGDVVARTSRYTWDTLLADEVILLPPPAPGGRDVPESAMLRVSHADDGLVRMVPGLGTRAVDRELSGRRRGLRHRHERIVGGPRSERIAPRGARRLGRRDRHRGLPRRRLEGA